MAYGTTDAQTLAGTVFYRIRQTGTNGSSAYSIVVKASALPAHPVASLYPNPARDFLYISSLQQGIIYHAAVTDLSGRIILTKELTNSDNRIFIHSVAKGIYILHLTAPSGITNIKFVKQ